MEQKIFFAPHDAEIRFENLARSKTKIRIHSTLYKIKSKHNIRF